MIIIIKRQENERTRFVYVYTYHGTALERARAFGTYTRRAAAGQNVCCYTGRLLLVLLSSCRRCISYKGKNDHDYLRPSATNNTRAHFTAAFGSA